MGIYIFFVGFWHFSFLNVVTGVVMEKAVRNAQPDREALALERRRKDDEHARQLREFFAVLDADNSCTLTYSEFRLALLDRDVRAHLASLDINISDAEMFF